MHTCRFANTSDIPLICRLEKELNRLHHQAAPKTFRAPEEIADNQAYWELQVSKPNCFTLVAEVDGEAVGFIAGELGEESHPLAQPLRFVRVGAVCVANSARGQGIGRSLVTAAECWASEHGAEEVRLSVWKFNEPAVGLYESNGYATRSMTMSKRVVRDA